MSTLTSIKDGSLGGPHNMSSFRDGSLGNLNMATYQDGSLGNYNMASFRDGSLGGCGCGVGAIGGQVQVGVYLGGAALLLGLGAWVLTRKK